MQRFHVQRFAWLVLVAIVAGVAGGVPLASTAQAQAPTGTISGTVVDGQGQPLAGVQVGADELDYESYGWTVTDSSGNYTMEVDPAVYRVEFYGLDGFSAQYYDGTTLWSEATPVEVGAGQHVTGIDATLEERGVITGRVVDGQGQPLAGVQVSANELDYGSFGWAETDSSGNYTMEVERGTYRVWFGGLDGFVGQYYDGTTSWSEATPVEVGAGQHVAGIDAIIEDRGVITGRVLDHFGNPVADASVEARNDDEGGAGGTTDAQGRYRLWGLDSGSYRIWIDAVGYSVVYYPGTFTYDDAVLVPVVVDEQTVLGDVHLREGGSIAGTVTVPGDLQWGYVCADGVSYSCADVDASGSYEVTNLAPGEYRVHFSADWEEDGQWSYGYQYYDGVTAWDEATLVTVVGTEVTPGIDATLTASSGGGNPALPGDFDGDGLVDLGVFRPSTGGWHIMGFDDVYLGLPGDVPVPGDYDGDGVNERAVWRPSTGAWFIDGWDPVYLGLPGDIPVPADYDGDGVTDLAVFRPSTGAWHVEGWDPFYLGVAGDIPVTIGYWQADPTVFRPSTGAWYSQSGDMVYLGGPGDVPAPAGFGVDGIMNRTVFRPSTGAWFVDWFSDTPVTHLGLEGDVPVPGHYETITAANLAVFRPSTGAWVINDVNAWEGERTTHYFGLPGDIPLLQRPTPY